LGRPVEAVALGRSGGRLAPSQKGVAAQGDDDPHHALSSNFPPWLSLLTCYHFGYHREHHEAPGVPWWRLPELRWKNR